MGGRRTRAGRRSPRDRRDEGRHGHGARPNRSDVDRRRGPLGAVRRREAPDRGGRVASGRRMPREPSVRRETAGEFDYDRTVALSDGVFAIALTLLVLNVGATDLGPGRHVSFHHVIDHAWPEIGSYAISFAVLALFWARHHAFFRSLRRI